MPYVYWARDWSGASDSLCVKTGAGDRAQDGKSGIRNLVDNETSQPTRQGLVALGIVQIIFLNPEIILAYFWGF